MAHLFAGLTTRGSCLLAGGVSAGVAGLILGSADLTRSGLFAIAVVLIAAVVVARSRVRLVSQRHLTPSRASAGEAVVQHLTVTNQSRLATGAMMFEEQLPSRADSHVRFVIDHLAGHESRAIYYCLPQLPRGRYRCGPLHVRMSDPFGMIEMLRPFSQTTDFVVAPTIDPLPSSARPRAQDAGNDSGSHTLGIRGADNVSTRQYNTGDPLRKVHWRSTARTGTLMVRQDELPTLPRCCMLLDLRASAHYIDTTTTHGDRRVISSLEWAISAAASIGTQLLTEQSELELICDPRVAEPVRLSTRNAIADYLAGVTALHGRNLRLTSPALTRSTSERTVIAIVGSLEPAAISSLAALRAHNWSIPALAILLDVPTWSEPTGDSFAASTTRPAARAARALEAAGWRTTVARRSDRTTEAWQRLSRGGPGTRSSAMTPTLDAPQ